jgi:hypothetical protein
VIYNRSIRVSLSCKFGNGDLNVFQKDVGNNDEKNRTVGYLGSMLLLFLVKQRSKAK